MYDKENVYDEKIAPLMKQIIEICKEENIPMTAQFALKNYRDDDPSTENPMHCTSITPTDKEVHGEMIYEWGKFIAEHMMFGPNGNPFIMTSTFKGE